MLLVNAKKKNHTTVTLNVLNTVWVRRCETSYNLEHNFVHECTQEAKQTY